MTTEEQLSYYNALLETETEILEKIKTTKDEQVTKQEQRISDIQTKINEM